MSLAPWARSIEALSAAGVDGLYPTMTRSTERATVEAGAVSMPVRAAAGRTIVTKSAAAIARHANSPTGLPAIGAPYRPTHNSMRARPVTSRLEGRREVV